MDTAVTRESLRAYLTEHRNWVEVEPDVFECCVESPAFPRRIELDEDGATFTFRKDTKGDWRFLAGKSRRCSYAHLWVIPLDDPTVYAGRLMIDLQVSILPPGEPRPEQRPVPPDGFSYKFDLRVPGDLPYPPEPEVEPDWPDIEPPKDEG